MSPCYERITARSRKPPAGRPVASLRDRQAQGRHRLFGFPPNAGAVGTAAYLSVFESLYNTLRAMAEEGMTHHLKALRLKEAALEGNALRYGQDANVAALMSAEDIVRNTPWLEEIEEVQSGTRAGAI